MSVAPAPKRPRGTAPRSQLVLSSLLALFLVAVLVVVLNHHHSTHRIVGSGVAATQTRSLPAFRSVDATGIANLNVRMGPRQSVLVSADDNVVGRVTTRVLAGTLVIGTKPGSYSIRTPILVRVVAPSVAALTLEGSGDIAAGNIDTSALTLSLAGMGTIRASGATTHLRVTLSGEGEAQLATLKARDATAVISGDGHVTLTATNSLNGIIAGNGTISYLGHPAHVKSSVTGKGEIGPG